MKLCARVFCVLGILLLANEFSEARMRSEHQAMIEERPSLAKLTTKLLNIRQAALEGKDLRAAFSSHAPQAIRNGKIQAIVGLTEITEDFLESCRTAKIEVVGTHQSPGLNQVAIRFSSPFQLDAILNRPDVKGIGEEPVAKTMAGAATSQADNSIRAALARSTYSIDGTGIRVGVLSDSVNDTIGGTISGGLLTGSSPQSTGDLPASCRVIDPGPGGNTDEGAGMMELIYDLAPGCDLSFASAFTGYISFANNITALANDPSYECDVICDDVIYFIEPVYQDGPIAVSVNDVVAAGVPYFSSAGNNSNKAHEDDYFDVNSILDDTDPDPSGNDFHDFGQAKGLASDTHLAVMLEDGAELTLALHWDEPYAGVYGGGNGSEADLDLYVVSNISVPILPGNILASSDDTQGDVGAPSGNPFEFIQYTNGTGSSQTVYVVIDHVRGREPVQLHLWVDIDGSGTINDSNLLGDRTIYGHAAAEFGTAVAAIYYREIDQGGGYTGSGSVLDVESFSSLGGDLPFWFSSDGLTRYPTAITRAKPEITAPDGTDTTFFGSPDSDGTGYPNFFGTSAAAPHAAAVAALMLDADGTLTPAEIYSIMRSTAVDAETPGFDFLSGDGVIDAYDAVRDILEPTVTPTETNTATSTPTETVPTPTFTFTPTNTSTGTPTETVPTPTFTDTPTSTSTHTPTVTPTETVPTPTFTFTATNTSTVTPTETVPTPTFTDTPTNTATVTPTETVPTPTFTYTPTNTSTVTPTETVPTPTFTYTATSTSTVTPTETVPTETFTPTETGTETATPTQTETSATPSPTPTVTLTPTATQTGLPVEGWREY